MSRATELLTRFHLHKHAHSLTHSPLHGRETQTVYSWWLYELLRQNPPCPFIKSPVPLLFPLFLGTSGTVRFPHFSSPPKERAHSLLLLPSDVPFLHSLSLFLKHVSVWPESSLSLCFSVASLTDTGLGRMGVCEGGCRWTTNVLGNAAENSDTRQAGLPDTATVLFQWTVMWR